MDFYSVIVASAILTISAVIIYIICRTFDHFLLEKEELRKYAYGEYILHKGGEELQLVSMNTIKAMNDELQKQFKSMEEG